MGAALRKASTFKRRGYGWATAGLFIVTLAGHWIFGWFAYQDEQKAHAQPVVVSEFVVQSMRDTLENWQSEFLQLLWQVGGLAFLLYVGSPQSAEEGKRQEEKIDAILRAVNKKDADSLIADIDNRLGRE
jgi:lysylphosphatidylglycerol synthetase-like protein (DUF2156 family)